MAILDIDAIRDILPPVSVPDGQQIVELEPLRIVGIKNVTANDTYFRAFPGLSGDAGRADNGERIAQVAGILVLKEIPDRHSKLVLLASVDEAKFRRPVRRAISCGSR